MSHLHFHSQNNQPHPHFRTTFQLPDQDPHDPKSLVN